MRTTPGPTRAEPARQRRGQAVRDAVLDATLALVVERGYDFSVDDVAERAGVHKTTVYRRWGTKPALVAATIERLAEAGVPVVRTGDAVADLTALAVAVARSLRDPVGAQTLRALLAAGIHDPELAGLVDRFLATRYQLAVAIITDAVGDGLLDRRADPVLVWRAIVNPLHLDTALGRSPTDAMARSLVDLALDGARTR